MAQICTICSHKDKENINAAILKKESNRNIAKRYSISPAAVHRHKENHLATTLTKAQAAEEVTHADTLIGDLQFLKEKAMSLYN